MFVFWKEHTSNRKKIQTQFLRQQRWGIATTEGNISRGRETEEDTAEFWARTALVVVGRSVQIAWDDDIAYLHNNIY